MTNHIGLQSVYYSLLKSQTILHSKELYLLLTIKEITDTFGHGSTERIETRFYPDIKFTSNIDEPFGTWESYIYDFQHYRAGRIPERYRFEITNLDTAKAYVKRNLLSMGVSNRLKWHSLKTNDLDAIAPILNGLKEGISSSERSNEEMESRSLH